MKIGFMRNRIKNGRKKQVGRNREQEERNKVWGTGNDSDKYTFFYPCGFKFFV